MTKAEASAIWDLVSDLESTHVQLHQVCNMLAVYDEDLERDLTVLSDMPNAAEYFVSRYDRLRSIMDVMQTNLNNAANDMIDMINELFDTVKKSKPGTND